MDNDTHTFTAFFGRDLVTSGPLEAVLPVLKVRFDATPTLFLMFDDQTGQQVDFDLEGSMAEVLARAVPAKGPGGPGRPKLGVVSREVSLLPRHWEWLSEQQGGASGAIRRLVDQARKHEPEAQRVRREMDRLYRFLSAMAGDLPGYEEAIRALYASDKQGFESQIRDWPMDIREYAKRIFPAVPPGV